jgi:peptide methionine sulfoxide reductase msrA/msrB
MDKTSSLTPQLLQIIQNRGTEAPFSGEYCEPKSVGTYLCRRCGLALFRAHDQFHSGCGWPSFDLEIPDHVLRSADPDGTRTEILCARCQAHLGHVFKGEGFTGKNRPSAKFAFAGNEQGSTERKTGVNTPVNEDLSTALTPLFPAQVEFRRGSNTRHCVNSLSLDFVTDETVLDTEEAILAAGCFWGVEYYLKRLSGVLKTEVGYSGGHSDHPCYKEVCRGGSGHLEVLRVIFDPKKLSYEDLLKYFFEIHDPSQTNGQGPDIGEQYQSAIFYYNDSQKRTAESVMKLLINQGIQLATSLRPVAIFWPAETYHQDYYQKKGDQPYCHRYTRRF